MWLEPSPWRMLPTGGAGPVGGACGRSGAACLPGVARAPALPGLSLADPLRSLARRLWHAGLQACAASLSTRHDDAREDAPGARAAGPRALSAAEAARFREIMLPHLDAAYTLARYLTRDADAAGDVVQDAYLRAYRSFADFRGVSARAWLLAIVRNCHHTWRDHARRDQQRRAPDPMPVDADGEEGGPGPVDLLVDGETPESILLRRTEAEAVRALLEQLPEALREVLVLRELDDLSYREIAEVAGVPVGTVMSRLSRARRQFAALWEHSSGGEGTP